MSNLSTLGLRDHAGMLPVNLVGKGKLKKATRYFKGFSGEGERALGAKGIC